MCIQWQAQQSVGCWIWLPARHGRACDACSMHLQAQLAKLEAAAGNLLGQLGALCAEQLRKATILQGDPNGFPQSILYSRSMQQPVSIA